MGRSRGVGSCVCPASTQHPEQHCTYSTYMESDEATGVSAEASSRLISFGPILAVHCRPLLPNRRSVVVRRSCRPIYGGPVVSCCWLHSRPWTGSSCRSFAVGPRHCWKFDCRVRCFSVDARAVLGCFGLSRPASSQSPLRQGLIGCGSS